MENSHFAWTGFRGAGQEHPQQGNVGNHSAFWRIARFALELLIDREDADALRNDDWASYLAWSNLAKVAPSEQGNPGARLSDAQAAYTTELLHMEIKALLPMTVIVMVGSTYYLPIVESLQAGKRDAVGKAVRYREGGSERVWIFLERPEYGGREQARKDELAVLLERT